MSKWLFAFVLLAGCDSTTTPMLLPDLATPASSGGDMAMAAGTPTLTVNNTDAWCTVTVTVPPAAAVMFTATSKTFMAPANTTIMLQADPNPGFTTVKWTGVTTMAGSMATYVMTSAAQQTITACCPFTNGTGC